MQDLSFEYALKYFDTYKEQRKFLHLQDISSHSVFEGNIEFVDEKLFAFLVEFEKRGHLKDTIIHLYSDHGDHISPLAYTTSGASEKYHPMSYMIIPEDVAP
jgi:arylsulfatase A-like enzyme